MYNTYTISYRPAYPPPRRPPLSNPIKGEDLIYSFFPLYQISLFDLYPGVAYNGRIYFARSHRFDLIGCAFERKDGFDFGGGLYQNWQDFSFASVCGDDESSYRRAAGCLSQIGAGWQAAHLRRDGIRSLRIPTPGQIVHAAHHH